MGKSSMKILTRYFLLASSLSYLLLSQQSLGIIFIADPLEKLPLFEKHKAKQKDLYFEASSSAHGICKRLGYLRSTGKKVIAPYPDPKVFVKKTAAKVYSTSRVAFNKHPQTKLKVYMEIECLDWQNVSMEDMKEELLKDFERSGYNIPYNFIEFLDLKDQDKAKAYSFLMTFMREKYRKEIVKNGDKKYMETNWNEQDGIAMNKWTNKHYDYAHKAISKGKSIEIKKISKL